MDTQVEQTQQRPAQPQRHTGHSTKEHTHTHNRQNHRAHKPKCRHWGPCIDRARITWGGGPYDLPRHRHTNSTQTGRCPQVPASLPQGHMNCTERASMTLQATWNMNGGASTHPTPLNCLQQFSLILPPPSSPHAHFGLDHRGQGLGRLAGGKWREDGPFCGGEAGAESPGLSLGLAVGWGWG